MTLAFGGDPTPLGWAITAAYAAIAILCWRARGPRWFWCGLAVLLALLCVNKQLDAQTAITSAVRDMAKQQGWYATRRGVQVAAVAGGLALVASLAAGVLWSLRRDLARAWPAVAGLAVVGAYIALRMTSLHEVDAFMVGGPVPMKWWGELLGLTLIGWGAIRCGGARPRTVGGR